MDRRPLHETLLQDKGKLLTVWNKEEHVRQYFALFWSLFALRALDLFLAVAAVNRDPAVGQGVHAAIVSN